MLRNLREINKNEHRSKIRTKVIRRKFISSRNQQDPSLDIILTDASYLSNSKKVRKRKKPNEQHEILKIVNSAHKVLQVMFLPDSISS